MSDPVAQELAEPAEPLYDTWGAKGDAGSWCVRAEHRPADFSATAVNAWFGTVFAATLDAFAELVRPQRVFFNSLYHDDVPGVLLERQPHEVAEPFMQRVVAAAASFPAPLNMLDCDVDLLAYTRTVDSPVQPVRRWLRLANQFTIWGGPENPDPFVCFTVNHTLFRATSAYDDDNLELYDLNHPLLERALRRWEGRIGPIVDFSGLSGVYRYGFTREF